MATNAELVARRLAATPRGIAVAAPIAVARARNAEVWDVEGRRYIDFAGGIAVVNTGHLHPKVAAAVAAQLERYAHVCWQVTSYEPYVALAERLNALAPARAPRKTAFFSTGAEAVENAVKIARAATGRPGVIAFGGAFHGRTLLTLALTGKVAPYKVGFGPLPGGVYHAPFPAALHGVGAQESLAAIERIFRTELEAERFAAIVVEPVQGEGGFYVAPPGFLAELRRLCDRHGILLVADEVQTGFGRTGRLFALDGSGVEADLVVTAKSLAGGLPLSAVTGHAPVMDAPAPGGLGGTYAGNPLALAAALAVLEVMEEERLPERGARLGAELAARLEALRARVPAIAEVRAAGAMVAVELMRGGAPDADAARRAQARALEAGLLLLLCGVHGNVIRFLFPLTIEDAVFAEGVAILEDALLSLR
jgi:4-aminobutyrate aminotransferase